MKILEQLKELSKQRYVSAYSLAIFYLRFGGKEEALRWLEKVIKIEPALTLPLLKLTPFSFRGGPRFEALVEKIVSAWCKVNACEPKELLSGIEAAQGLHDSDRLWCWGVAADPSCD